VADNKTSHKKGGFNVRRIRPKNMTGGVTCFVTKQSQASDGFGASTDTLA
jgi:hypothetical protein